MKKIAVSVSLVALGAASIQAYSPVALTPQESSKPWSVSAALRGFYDDNWNTLPSNLSQSSYGVEVRPSVSFNVPLEQTFLGLSYVYGMKWFEGRPDNNIDHSHEINARMDHSFSERFKLELSDSFAVAQEPEVLSPAGGIIATPLRSLGDNLRNRANVNFQAQLTQKFGFVAGYANTIFDYDQEQKDMVGQFAGQVSRSALLDRVEHLFTLNGRMEIVPQTIGILGYQFGAVSYTSDELIGGTASSDQRDNYSQYGYVGVDHNFNSQLNASARVGLQYTDFHKQNQDSVGPYADAMVSYTYNRGSFLQAGLRHTRNQTDIGYLYNAMTLDQESTAVFAGVTHRFAGNLTGNLFIQYQNSEYNAPNSQIDGKQDDYILVNTSLTYSFNKFVAAETGYNLDRLWSDIVGRGFTRNRVFVGIRATY